MIKAGAVTCVVNKPNRGLNIIDIKKKIATKTAVKPVLPPTAIPALDSTKAPTGEVPKTEPTIIAVESDARALPTRGILLSFIKPACWAKPIKVPAVSKKVTKRKVSTTTHICRVLISLTWKIAWPNDGAILGATETILVGKGICPVTTPKIAARIIPIKIAPGTFKIIKTTVTIRPKMVIQTAGS